MRKEMILSVIVNKPGISFNEIVRETDLSNGVISHYILQLLKNKEIVKSEVGRAKYFQHNIPKKDIECIIICRNNTNFDIIKLFLRTKNPITVKEISKDVGKSNSTVSVNLKKIQKAKLVGRKILNRNSKLTSDIGYFLLNEEYIMKIISKYDLDA
tara:strand:+ start:512 stop:979 length:468 start_codon:yes stop_codon:yes gene_type:complete